MLNVVETSLNMRDNPPLRTIRRVIVHHSVSGDVSASTINQWHLGRGWRGIGYHYIIRHNGTIERGRPESQIGAHAGNANSDSIGICLTGNFTRAQPTEAQMQSLVSLIRDIRNRRGQNIAVMKHSDVGATACPGRAFPWDTLITRLNNN